MTSLKVGIGLSRNWDPKEAGREVARDALDRLGGKPRFVILSCTYEYYRNGGYQKLLDGVWEVLPEGTHLIGGTTSGFMIPRGCFSWGAVMLAVACDRMDVASAFGKGTKGNPKKAGRKTGEEIRRQLAASPCKNGFVFDITSGAILKKMPVLGYRKTSDSKIIGRFVSLMLPIMGIFGWGMGREEEVREGMMEVLPDFKGLGASTWADIHFSCHRQFYGKEVLNNSIVAVGLKSDFDVYVDTGFGFRKTDKKFTVTKKDRTGLIIKEINGKPARQEYLRILGWRPGVINEQITKRAFFVLPSFEKDGALYPEITTMFYGDYIIMGRRIDNPEMTMLTASGESMIGAVDEALKGFSKKPALGLIAECAARQEALGGNVFKEKKRIEKYLGNAPYLLLFSGAEFTYTPEQGCRHKHESFNIAAFETDEPFYSSSSNNLHADQGTENAGKGEGDACSGGNHETKPSSENVGGKGAS